MNGELKKGELLRPYPKHFLFQSLLCKAHRTCFADKIDDKQTENLSGEIAKKIQDEMTYPGQVKITVIRETRAVSFAK